MVRVVRKIFPQSYDQNFSDYPKETSIHGVKYLANRSRPLAERIFWIIIFIFSVSFLGYFVYKISRTWLENAVMITDQNSPTLVYAIPYPAVTICPQIKILANKFDLVNFKNDVKGFTNYTEFLDSDIGKKYIMASQICRKAFRKYAQSEIEDKEEFTGSFSRGILRNDWINTLHDVSPKLDEVFETCELTSFTSDHAFYEPSKNNCERLFSTIITNEGICFTFNGIRDILRDDSLQTDFMYHNITHARKNWNPENGYTEDDAYPHKGMVKGSPVSGNGLKFVVNANLSDATSYCFPRNVGYKIVLHSPTTYPSTYDNFIPLAYGKEYKIAAIPKTIETGKDLRTFAPEARNCFFNDERKLKFFTFYTEENCRLECYANYSAQMFHGTPFSLPRDSNTTNCILPHKNFGWDLPEFMALLQEYGRDFNMSFSTFFSVFNCNCLPECNAIHYEHQIMNTNDDYSLQFQDELTDTDRIIQTTFEIIFNERSFIGKQRVPMYSFETMVSDFGGLLGLFMGGSILSLFELCYFLTIRNCSKK